MASKSISKKIDLHRGGCFSGVLDCDERLYFQVVKTAFQQRRKTLRNSLKTFSLPANLKEDTIFGQRPEQLGVSDFVRITNLIAHDAFSA